MLLCIVEIKLIYYLTGRCQMIRFRSLFSVRGMPSSSSNASGFCICLYFLLLVWPFACFSFQNSSSKNQNISNRVAYLTCFVCCSARAPSPSQTKTHSLCPPFAFVTLISLLALASNASS